MREKGEIHPSTLSVSPCDAFFHIMMQQGGVPQVSGNALRYTNPWEYKKQTFLLHKLLHL